MKSILTALLLGILVGCGGGDSAVLRFTAIPDQNTTELRQKFDPVARYLSEELGVEVEYVPSKDYQASVEMFRNGDIHLAWFGGLTGVQARERVKGARAIVQGRVDPSFYSYFIAHKDSGLVAGDSFPVAIADRRFTFGSRSSTSGRLMPESILKQATGKTAEEFFSKAPGFSGSHDKTAELVESGQYEAGVLNYQVYDRRVREGKTDPEVCRIIWKTPTFADYNMTAHPDLETIFGEGFTDRLQRALIEMKDPALLAAFGRESLIEAGNEDFAELRDVAIALEMLR